MEYIGVSYNVVECVVTLRRWMILLVMSCAAVMSVCGAGSVLYRVDGLCVLLSSF
jgi:hypothetical protein